MMELLIFALGVSIAFNAKTESISPIVVEPESPMKIAAGEKLKNKNANNEPARENESKDITISSAIKNQIPKIEEAINPIPAARGKRENKLKLDHLNRNVMTELLPQPHDVVVALDIGTTKVCCLAGRRNKHGKLEIVGIGKVESVGVLRGVVSNIEKTVNAIREAIDTAVGYQCLP